MLPYDLSFQFQEAALIHELLQSSDALLFSVFRYPESARSVHFFWQVPSSDAYCLFSASQSLPLTLSYLKAIFQEFLYPEHLPALIFLLG